MYLKKSMNLQNLILDRLDEESLYILSLKYPSLHIEEEWKRRLSTCKEEDYLPVLEFFSSEKITKSKLILSALYNLRYCFPWKIGVIYNFKTGKIYSAEIRIGKHFGRYQVKGKNLLFSWLDMNENKKMLKEVISSNYIKKSLFSTVLNDNKSKKVRDLILNNKKLTLDLLVIQKNNVSMPGQQPLREDFVVYPYFVSSNSTTVKLTHETGNNIVRKEIPIRFSSEVEQYLKVIS